MPDALPPVEGSHRPDMSPGRAYVAGASFYDADIYPDLAKEA